MPRIVALISLLLLSTATNALAQTDFSMLKLRAGDAVFVSEATGTEAQGRVVSLSPTSLVLDSGRTFSPQTTLKIDRRGDSLRNGAIVGAAVLGGICSVTCGFELRGGRLAAAMATNAGLGALLGAFIDSDIVGRTTVFRQSPTLRVAPTVTRSGGGVSFSIVF